MTVTQHAVDALAIFYPTADAAMVLDEVRRGVPVEPDTAQALVGRARHRPGSTYVLHRERTGLFAIAGNGAIVTFLRFYSLMQYELTARLWPGGDPPTTTEPTWLRATKRTPEELVKEHVPGDPGQPIVTPGAARAARRSKLEVSRLVRDAVDAGEVAPPDGRAASVPIHGVVTIAGTALGVVFESECIRVVALAQRPLTKDERIAQKALRTSAMDEQRRLAADRQAAEHLRSRGWTCIPPGGAR